MLCIYELPTPHFPVSEGHHRGFSSHWNDADKNLTACCRPIGAGGKSWKSRCLVFDRTAGLGAVLGAEKQPQLLVVSEIHVVCVDIQRRHLAPNFFQEDRRQPLLPLKEVGDVKSDADDFYALFFQLNWCRHVPPAHRQQCV